MKHKAPKQMPSEVHEDPRGRRVSSRGVMAVTRVPLGAEEQGLWEELCKSQC